MKKATFTLILAASLIWFGTAMTDRNAENEAIFVYGDALPDAPELSQRGKHAVGVQTIQLVHKDQIDILNYSKEKEARYDRPLTAEVWYPAELTADQRELTEYDEVLGNANTPDRPLIPFTFLGRAARNATPDLTNGAYPLVVVSHGYTGSRYIMTYLTEHLASKGYVVVAIAHTESTFSDAGNFSSTLLNRPLDILFVVDEIAKLSAKGSTSFLAGLADANNTAIVGYSMGGYGVLNVAGAGYSEQLLKFFAQTTGGSMAVKQRTTGAPEMSTSKDERIKAVVAFAPWGMNYGAWDAEGLKGLTLPTLFVAGSQDDISGYENGIKAIFTGAVNSERYLLTYDNARHNVAPNPPPKEALKAGLHIDEYLRYADSAWDQRRINNINQHFVSGFLGMKLKGEENQSYFEVKEDSNEALWTGFKPRTSVGLSLLKGQ